MKKNYQHFAEIKNLIFPRHKMDSKDDQEEDPYITRIKDSGCFQEHEKLQDCYFEKKDWRECKAEMAQFRSCFSQKRPGKT
jgi:hypothetical protein